MEEMNDMEGMNLFQFLFGKVDTWLNDYVINASTTLMTALKPVAMTCFAIYILLWGYMHLTNKIEQPAIEMTNHLLKAIIVLTFALNVDIYTDWIVTFVTQTPPALASILSSDSPTGGISSDYDGTALVLDQLLTKGFDLGGEAWEQAGVWSGNVGMYLVSMIYYLSAILLTAAAAIWLLLARVFMTIALVLGPIFILLHLFNVTKSFLTVWITALMNYMLTYVLTVVVVSLMFSILGVVFDGDNATKDASTAFQLLTLSLIGVVALVQVPSIASSLSGGLGLSATTGGIGRLGFGLGGRLLRGGKTTQNLRDMKANQRAKNIMDAGGRRKHAVQSTKAAGARVANMYRRKNSISR